MRRCRSSIVRRRHRLSRSLPRHHRHRFLLHLVFFPFRFVVVVVIHSIRFLGAKMHQRARLRAAFELGIFILFAFVDSYLVFFLGAIAMTLSDSLLAKYFSTKQKQNILFFFTKN